METRLEEIYGNINAEIYNQLKDLKVALSDTGARDHDVEYTQALLDDMDSAGLDCDDIEGIIYDEVAHAIIREAIINYFLDREKEMPGLIEKLDSAVLENRKSRLFNGEPKGQEQ